VLHLENVEPNKKIILGLSGGVDSSVAALMLQSQGWDVVGVFLKIWDDQDPHCPAALDAADARQIAQKLNIPWYAYDYAEEYRKSVFDYFLFESRAGRTPNPDILCNRHIKFSAFLEKADLFDAPFIATGHYAKKHWNDQMQKWELHRPEDKEKDQTYFLYAITQSQLARSIFPLESMNKKNVRDVAGALRFQNAQKKGSVGICMVGERNYAQFLQQFLPQNPGIIRQKETGKKVGEHIGLNFYTIGQRHSLHIGGVAGAKESPWFVVSKDFQTNDLIVSQEESCLLQSEIIARNLTWIAEAQPDAQKKYQATIRYRGEVQECTIQFFTEPETTEQKMKVHFSVPVRAVAAGQSVVIYENENCLGGGEICED